MEQVLDAVIAAAEHTAKQATGNDRKDWDSFANALRAAKQQLAQPKTAKE